jgi:trimethylamine:corrinoid methyltransferase-like protein
MQGEETFPIALPREELDQIRESMFRILEEVGITVLNDKLREKLKNLNFSVNDKRVCIEQRTVRDFLELESSYNGQLYRKRSWSVAAEEGPFTLRVNDYIQNIHDLKTNQIVPFTTDSLIQMTMLLDVLHDRGVVTSPPGLPPDVSAPLGPVLQYWVAASYSRQGRWPVDPKTMKSFPYIREMSEVLGCPLKDLDVWVISPLTLGGESLEAVLYYADQLEFVRVANMGSIGSTLPIKIGDAFAVSLAEVIGSTILLREVLDIPLIWDTYVCPTDFRSAAMVIGSPESMLLELLTAQVNSFMHGQMGNPSPCLSIMTMAKLPGAQSCAEKASAMTAGVLYGQREFKYGGSLALDEVFSAEQLLYDLEIKDHAQRIAGGMKGDCDPGRCLTDVKEAIYQGTFLGLDSTLDSFRKYFWDPKLFERNSLSSWKTQGGRGIRDRSREMVRKLIRQHEFGLDRDVQRQVDKVLDRAKNEL